MDIVVTMRDVAKEAGVSLAAVSAVVNGTTHTRMSDQTRRRIERVIADVRYVPNQAARSLRWRQTRRIALVLHRMDTPTLRESVRGFHDAATELGRATILGDANWFTPGTSLLSQLLAEGTVDGVVVHTPGALDAEVREHLSRHPRPLVAMENMGDDSLWVSIDEHDAGYRATQHLIDLGHRSIAWAGDTESRAWSLRRDGYAAAMRAAGLSPEYVRGAPGYEAGGGVIEDLQRLMPRPTGLVAFTGSTAIGVMAAAHDVGLRVPEDLSIVAIHDLDVAEYVRPALTCVRAPLYELGARAARLAAGGENAIRGVITDVPNELVIRSSTSVPPGRA